MGKKEELTRAKEWLEEFSTGDPQRLNLEQVEIAIAREEQGCYGICQICGDPIDYTVISTQPHITTCMECGLRSNSFPWSSPGSRVP